MKTFMKNLKDKTYEIKYPTGYIKLFNKDNMMYAEGSNTIKHNEKIILSCEKVTFTFIDNDDLQNKCEDLLQLDIRFCDCCNKPINKGFTDDYADFYNCKKCFPKEMDKHYGINNWRSYKNEYDECNSHGGMYEYFDTKLNTWEDEPSYYTEWF